MLTKVTDNEGKTTQYEYQEQGGGSRMITKVTDKAGAVTNLAWYFADDAGGAWGAYKIEVTDAAGLKSVYDRSLFSLVPKFLFGNALLKSSALLPSPGLSQTPPCQPAADGVLSKEFPPPGVVDDWADWLRTEDEENVARIRTTTRIGRHRGGKQFLVQLESLLGRILHPNSPWQKSCSARSPRRAYHGEAKFGPKSRPPRRAGRYKSRHLDFCHGLLRSADEKQRQ